MICNYKAAERKRENTEQTNCLVRQKKKRNENIRIYIDSKDSL